LSWKHSSSKDIDPSLAGRRFFLVGEGGGVKAAITKVAMAALMLKAALEAEVVKASWAEEEVNGVKVAQVAETMKVKRLRKIVRVATAAGLVLSALRAADM
jgi:hypothetical protein